LPSKASDANLHLAALDKEQAEGAFSILAEDKRWYVRKANSMSEMLDKTEWMPVLYCTYLRLAGIGSLQD